ncbi:fungal hydrophobin-domain-containing protein [Fomes fomentarius]|nr:fungal hydrophobin-domain-containing protein [Fomes fomentarius]
MDTNFLSSNQTLQQFTATSLSLDPIRSTSSLLSSPASIPNHVQPYPHLRLLRALPEHPCDRHGPGDDGHGHCAHSHPTSAGDCTTGPVQCCNSVQSASSPAASTLLGLLDIVVQGVDLLVGLTCSPITIIGIGGGSCQSTVVCCEDNSHGGLISIGCVPVNLS